MGSCARSLALVHAEVFVNEFVPARPFRVNAGAVHSYVAMSDGALKYLCELRAGDRVRVSNIETRADRDVVVGRVKIEPRPLIKVDYTCAVGEGHVFLQQAETVRLVCEAEEERGWQTLPVTAIGKGDRLYVLQQSRGTHVGKAIDADVLER